MPNTTWENRRLDERIAEDADQAEFVAIKYDSCNLEAGTFDDRIADALDDYEVRDPKEVAKWAAEDIKFDNATSEIAIEIQRRAELLGANYPFALNGNQLVYRRSDTLVYEFCLAVSESPSLKEDAYARLPVAFERLVRDVLICFLGPGAEGFRTGWPGDAHEDRPPRFKALITKLHESTGKCEWHWCPDAGLPNDPEPQDIKDEGLDVVVWKAIADKRGGRLFLLGQCACGGSYATKYYDIDQQFHKLSKWVKPLSWASPVRVFSTPRHIPNNDHFAQVNREAGLTIDGVRLTLIAEQADHRAFIKAQMKVPYADLIKLVITDPQAA